MGIRWLHHQRVYLFHWLDCLRYATCKTKAEQASASALSLTMHHVFGCQMLKCGANGGEKIKRIRGKKKWLLRSRRHLSESISLGVGPSYNSLWSQLLHAKPNSWVYLSLLRIDYRLDFQSSSPRHKQTTPICIFTIGSLGEQHTLRDLRAAYMKSKFKPP